MTLRRALSMLMVACAAALLLCAGLRADSGDETGFVRIFPEDVQWKELPGYNGLKYAVLDGDPAKPGMYVVRVKFPPGLMTRPHFHPDDRHAIVISGTWYTGTGDVFDPSQAVALKAGSYMKHPGKGHHFDGAKDEEVVLQIIGYGPGGTTFIHPDDGHTGSSR